MRGKVYAPPVSWKYDRITPAYAGKSGQKRFFRGGCLGSPPPMRGKVSNRGAKNRRGGDHPRLCGEKDNFSRNDILGIGSPPPMRGKVIVPLRDLADLRITPAYAGKSRLDRSGHLQLQDHPRLCGEKPTPRMQFRKI